MYLARDLNARNINARRVVHHKGPMNAYLFVPPLRRHVLALREMRETVHETVV
jgi:hypothetical protein